MSIQDNKYEIYVIGHNLMDYVNKNYIKNILGLYMWMREGITQFTPAYSVMREYPRTLKPFHYDTWTTNRTHWLRKGVETRERISTRSSLSKGLCRPVLALFIKATNS